MKVPPLNVIEKKKIQQQTERTKMTSSDDILDIITVFFLVFVSRFL